MKQPGVTDLPVRTRAALLDALEALEAHLDALIVIGAQALYLHTGDAEVPVPSETKDADLGIDGQRLRDAPLLEQAIESAGFHKEHEHPQPGRWLSPDGIPVDLMVPEAMAGPAAPNRRGARLPPHDSGSMRRANGLEPTIVDNQPAEIRALDPADPRTYTVRVAGASALLVAKLHKIGERNEIARDRLRDKDAHDLYRLLVAIETPDLARDVRVLLEHRLSRSATRQALTYLEDLFAAGPDAIGSQMAGRSEIGIGEPAVVAASVAALAADLLEDLIAHG